MFQPVESSVSFPKLEEAVARLWQEGQIYEKTLSARAERRHLSSMKARRRPTGSPIRATALPDPLRICFPAINA